jgi:shikimate dehydrogenase
MTTRLAVLGSPIAHSKSPTLHRAAYATLGLDWQYDAIEVVGEELPGFIASRGPEWRGVSLTMPLKRDVVPLLHERARLVELSGAANTVVFDGGLRGFNTDVFGIVAALRDHVEQRDTALILGGGATAGSALFAVADLGFSRVRILVRNLAKTAELAAIAESLALTVKFGTLDEAIGSPDLIVSTIPGHAEVELEFALPVRRSAVLFDVAYEPWPSAIAAQWFAADGTVVAGIEMLAWQALAQVRTFVNGDPDAVLAGEDAVWAAMRASVGLTTVP